MASTDASALCRCRIALRVRQNDARQFVQFPHINSFSAWREHKLVFQVRPLKAVPEELGRYHHASITVTAPKILDTQVSGIFPTNNLPQALQTIATALPIKLTQTGPQSWQIDRR